MNVLALQQMQGHSTLEKVQGYLVIAETDVENAHREPGSELVSIGHIVRVRSVARTLRRAAFWLPDRQRLVPTS